MLISVRAAVYYFRDNAWQAEDGGLSLVNIYHHPMKATYRVVATSQVIRDKVGEPPPQLHPLSLARFSNPPPPESKVVIDTPLYKELTYQKPAKTFHQFSDSKFAYGLNFASQLEANSFASTLLTAVDKLNGSPPPPSCSSSPS